MNIVFANGDVSRVNAETAQGLRGGRRRGSSEEARARRVEREARMQEMENARIAKISKRMDGIRGLGMDEELSLTEQNAVRESRANLLDMLANQIARIYETRAAREAATMEQEAREMQAQLEERIREREEEAEERAEAQRELEPPTREEATQATEWNMLRNFARVDANNQAIHTLTQVRGARSMEALQLRHAIESPNSGGFAAAVEVVDGHAITHPVAVNQSAATDFRITHLQALETGIARVDEAILHRIADMYRDSQRDWVEYNDEEEEMHP